MKKFIKENWFKLSIVLGILLISVSVFYYFFFFLPHREQSILDRQQQEKLTEEQKIKNQRDMLNSCLEDAKNKIKDFVQKNCEPDGKNYICGDGSVDPYKKQVNDECFRLYPPIK